MESPLDSVAQERVNQVTIHFQREVQKKVRQFDMYCDTHMAWLREIVPETRKALQISEKLHAGLPQTPSQQENRAKLTDKKSKSTYGAPVYRPMSLFCGAKSKAENARKTKSQYDEPSSTFTAKPMSLRTQSSRRLPSRRAKSKVLANQSQTQTRQAIPLQPLPPNQVNVKPAPVPPRSPEKKPRARRVTRSMTRQSNMHLEKENEEQEEEMPSLRTEEAPVSAKKNKAKPPHGRRRQTTTTAEAARPVRRSARLSCAFSGVGTIIVAQEALRPKEAQKSTRSSRRGTRNSTASAKTLEEPFRAPKISSRPRRAAAAAAVVALTEKSNKRRSTMRKSTQVLEETTAEPPLTRTRSSSRRLRARHKPSTHGESSVSPLAASDSGLASGGENVAVLSPKLADPVEKESSVATQEEILEKGSVSLETQADANSEDDQVVKMDSTAPCEKDKVEKAEVVEEETAPVLRKSTRLRRKKGSKTQSNTSQSSSSNSRKRKSEDQDVDVSEESEKPKPQTVRRSRRRQNQKSKTTFLPSEAATGKEEASLETLEQQVTPLAAGEVEEKEKDSFLEKAPLENAAVNSEEADVVDMQVGDQSAKTLNSPTKEMDKVQATALLLNLAEKQVNKENSSSEIPLASPDVVDEPAKAEASESEVAQAAEESGVYNALNPEEQAKILKEVTEMRNQEHPVDDSLKVLMHAVSDLPSSPLNLNRSRENQKEEGLERDSFSKEKEPEEEKESEMLDSSSRVVPKAPIFKPVESHALVGVEDREKVTGLQAKLLALGSLRDATPPPARAERLGPLAMHAPSLIQDELQNVLQSRKTAIDKICGIDSPLVKRKFQTPKRNSPLLVRKNSVRDRVSMFEQMTPQSAKCSEKKVRRTLSRSSPTFGNTSTDATVKALNFAENTEEMMEKNETLENESLSSKAILPMETLDDSEKEKEEALAITFAPRTVEQVVAQELKQENENRLSELSRRLANMRQLASDAQERKKQALLLQANRKAVLSSKNLLSHHVHFAATEKEEISIPPSLEAESEEKQNSSPQMLVVSEDRPSSFEKDQEVERRASGVSESSPTLVMIPNQPTEEKVSDSPVPDILKQMENQNHRESDSTFHPTKEISLPFSPIEAGSRRSSAIQLSATRERYQVASLSSDKENAANNMATPLRHQLMRKSASVGSLHAHKNSPLARNSRMLSPKRKLHEHHGSSPAQPGLILSVMNYLFGRGTSAATNSDPQSPISSQLPPTPSPPRFSSTSPNLPHDMETPSPKFKQPSGIPIRRADAKREDSQGYLSPPQVAVVGRGTFFSPPTPKHIEIPTSPLEEYSSDSDADEEAKAQKKRRKRKAKLPWARTPQLAKALQQQHHVDPDDIFRSRETTIDLAKVFSPTVRFVPRSSKRKLKRRKYPYPRTSSGEWSRDDITRKEELRYKRRMGYSLQRRK